MRCRWAQRLVLIRVPKVNRPVAANALKYRPYAFRGGVSATQTIFQTPTSASDQQLIDPEADFKLCTEWA